MILGTVTEIQEVESVNKGDSSYVKDENTMNVGIDSRSVWDNSNKDSNPVVEACTLVFITNGVDDSSTLNLKGDKEQQMDPTSNELPLVRPKSTWTRIN